MASNNLSTVSCTMARLLRGGETQNRLREDRWTITASWVSGGLYTVGW